MSTDRPNRDGDGGDPADPGEGRLVAYLEELREDPPATDAKLAHRIHRSARWQGAIRAPLEIIGHFGGAFFDGIATMLGRSRRTDR